MTISVFKNTLTAIIIGIVLINCPVFAQDMQQVQNVSASQSYNNSFSKGYGSIDWLNLDLSEDQKKQITTLNEDWKRVQQLIRPKIIRDQQKLKNVMSSPNADENEIRKLQGDIMLRQKQLRFEATENFLSKRRILSNQQREKLHKMMSP